MDEFSDLDFFVIAAAGCKQPFIHCLEWLEEICPLAYRFKNCELGYKFLFEDGIYGEFAVFELEELNNAQYTGGRMIWRRPTIVNENIVEGSSPLGELLPGYDKTPEAALRLLEFLESIYPINPRMSKEIRALVERCIKQRTEE